MSDTCTYCMVAVGPESSIDVLTQALRPFYDDRDKVPVLCRVDTGDKIRINIEDQRSLTNDLTVLQVNFAGAVHDSLASSICDNTRHGTMAPFPGTTTLAELAKDYSLDIEVYGLCLDQGVAEHLRYEASTGNALTDATCEMYYYDPGEYDSLQDFMFENELDYSPRLAALEQYDYYAPGFDIDNFSLSIDGWVGRNKSARHEHSDDLER